MAEEEIGIPLRRRGELGLEIGGCSFDACTDGHINKCNTLKLRRTVGQEIIEWSKQP